MALVVTNLTSTFDSVDRSVYTVPSADYPANQLILLSLVASRAGTPNTPTITGLTGATWTAIENFVMATSASPSYRMCLFRTMIGTSQNTITLTASYGGLGNTGFAAIVDTVSGCATSGSDGAGAVVQSTFTQATTNTLTITLPAGPGSANGVYGYYNKASTAAYGVPSGFTESTELGHAAPVTRIMTAYDLSAPPTSWTSTQTVSSVIGGIGFELLPQVVSGGTVLRTRRLLAGVGV